ncbi:MAG: amylo-alpha-1,6-glucosidase [Vicinamibacteria bacterium]
MDGREFLEADGLGGFASGTVAGERTRRYHALLLAATTPPTGRYVLVNGLDAWLTTASGRHALTRQRYVSDDGVATGAAFTAEPWPTWTFALPDGTEVRHELLVAPGAPRVLLRWSVSGAGPAALEVRPFLSGRDYHALHHENDAFRFDADVDGDRVRFQPYAEVPATVARSNGAYVHEPYWYRSFLYAEERARGLDHVEDLGSPGVFRFDLTAGAAVLVLAADGAGLPPGVDAAGLYDAVAQEETVRRGAFASPLHRAADAYVVRRGTAGRTIVAGYPWFTDWGRDTFVALRGLCLAAGRLDDARAILLEWSGAVRDGLLPNRFPDRGDVPEYNAVDASLWFVVAVHEYLEAAARRPLPEAALDRERLVDAVEAILDGYARGTRHGIRADADGLLAAGEPGLALTWMDARVDGRSITPRIGKPVEVQALWLNALRIASAWSPRWVRPLARGQEAFAARFWNDAAGCLYDVVDVDGEEGAVDAAFRPNQVFAVGGLPFPLLAGERARAVVDAVERRLLTPAGLRTLAADAPGYVARYEGGVALRDGAYHQGTVWPWLLGPFVEAWVRVRGGTAGAKAAARRRFLEPLLRHLADAGVGHLSEIADAEPPHTPRGCPFQAWSVGEALRLDRVVLRG